MGNILKATLKFARPRIIVTCCVIALLGSAVAGGFTFKSLIALLIIVAFTVHANSINDYTDLEIDRINLAGASDRPLVTGDISWPQFWLIHVSSGVTALLLSLSFGLPGIAATVAILIIDYLYSLRPALITDRTYGSPLLLAAAYVYYPLSLGVWAVDPHGAYPWLLSVGLFVGFLARLLLKDFRDTIGDKRHGKVTFLLRYGVKATCNTSLACWLLAMMIVAAATASYAVAVTLLIGSLTVGHWITLVRLAESPLAQQQLVKAVANAANIAIVIIFVYYLCHQTELTSLGADWITAITGTALLAYNWLRSEYPNRSFRRQSAPAA